jgi:hypothetical protein
MDIQDYIRRCCLWLSEYCGYTILDKEITDEKEWGIEFYVERNNVKYTFISFFINNKTIFEVYKGCGDEAVFIKTTTMWGL